SRFLLAAMTRSPRWAALSKYFATMRSRLIGCWSSANKRPNSLKRWSENALPSFPSRWNSRPPPPKSCALSQARPANSILFLRGCWGSACVCADLEAQYLFCLEVSDLQRGPKHNPPAELLEKTQPDTRFRPGQASGIGRSIRAKQVVQIPNIINDQAYL